MNDRHRRHEGVSSRAPQERSIGEMADTYSRQAREARIKQGKPPVIKNAGVLNRIAEIMATENLESQPQGRPAA